MITVLALILLILRLVAVRLLYKVTRAQRDLMRRPIVDLKRQPIVDEEITSFRHDLYRLTMGLLTSNIPAIIVDAFFVLKGIEIVWITASDTPILVFYTISNALSAVIAATLVHKIYKDALKVDTSHADSDHTLMNDQ